MVAVKVYSTGRWLNGLHIRDNKFRPFIREVFYNRHRTQSAYAIFSAPEIYNLFNVVCPMIYRLYSPFHKNSYDNLKCKNSPNLRVKLPCRKCKILNVREIFVLSFIVSEKILEKKKMDDALALRLENKKAIHC